MLLVPWFTFFFFFFFFYFFFTIIFTFFHFLLLFSILIILPKKIKHPKHAVQLKVLEEMKEVDPNTRRNKVFIKTLELLRFFLSGISFCVQISHYAASFICHYIHFPSFFFSIGNRGIVSQTQKLLFCQNLPLIVFKVFFYFFFGVLTFFFFFLAP